MTFVNNAHSAFCVNGLFSTHIVVSAEADLDSRLQVSKLRLTDYDHDFKIQHQDQDSTNKKHVQLN